VKIGLLFGFLTVGSYSENELFFQRRGFSSIKGLGTEVPEALRALIAAVANTDYGIRLFVDISSMSREMAANVVLGIDLVRRSTLVEITVAYAPSAFSGVYPCAPILHARPIKTELAGWSARPEKPLGIVLGIGCEEGLALGALQFLEPDKAWIFSPIGLDAQFDLAVGAANEHIGEIFDASVFRYDLGSGTITRGRFEALLNSVDGDFRVVAVPFGPKILNWLFVSTIVFNGRRDVGIWSFSSKEIGSVVDRGAEGPIVWHQSTVISEGSTSDLSV